MQLASEPAPGRRVENAAAAGYAFIAYLAMSLAATWPLVRGLGRDVAGDLGDPLLVMWILTWNCEQLRSILSGDLTRISTFFDANIFHPAPLALAYSDHFIPQALQIFPIYLVTGNPILCYNVLLLSTFALAGLGMYLLVHELTGNRPAALLAGVAFAFAPYRLAQHSHLHVLSSQWMPFALLGLLRFLRTRRLAPLAWGGLALAVQCLSSGYYLLFFVPFVVAFVLWEVVFNQLWRDRRVWLGLAVTALVVAAVMVPFLLPYAALRGQSTATRSIVETSQFSADVYSYATVNGGIWGQALRAFPKPEGDLFPGIVSLVLAAVGLVLTAARTRSLRDPQKANGPLRVPQWVEWLLAAAVAGHAVAAVITLLQRRVVVDLGVFAVRMSNVDQLILRALIAFVLLMVVSPQARARTAAFMRTQGFFALAALGAFWLSLGPSPQSLGRPVDIASPYRWLLENVPGFDGVRVPARFAMIVACMLSVLAGYGAAHVAGWRRGRWVLGILAALVFAEGVQIPFVVNAMTPLRDYNTPEARVYVPERAPAVYVAMARQPPASVLVELPLGVPDYDLRAVYYSASRTYRLANGYSGFFPPHYSQLTGALSEIPRHPELSRDALDAVGATHVIVHEGAYRDAEGTMTTTVLQDIGAVELFRDGSDVLLELRR